MYLKIIIPLVIKDAIEKRKKQDPKKIKCVDLGHNLQNKIFISDSTEKKDYLLKNSLEYNDYIMMYIFNIQP